MEFLPPGLSPLAAAVVIGTSLLGSAITAAFSIGGGLLLITVMAAVVPASALVPVHGVVMVGSNAGRFAVLRDHVDWPTYGWFALGAGIGGLAGGGLLSALGTITLPGPALRLVIAGFVLFTQWGPKVTLPLGRRSFTAAGVFSTFLTLFVGASGPFMTAILAKMPGYARQTLIATSGACMTLQHAAKCLVFVALGFAYAPWLPFIGACIAVGFVGTLCGTALLGRLNEGVFRGVLKWLLTGLAVYLAVSALLALL